MHLRGCARETDNEMESELVWVMVRTRLQSDNKGTGVEAQHMPETPVSCAQALIDISTPVPKNVFKNCLKKSVCVVCCTSSPF